MVGTKETFPEARRVIRPASPDSLLNVARHVVREESEAKFFPKYEVRAGERVLLVAPSFVDKSILRAFRRAIAEVTHPADVMIGYDLTELPKGGERELDLFKYMFAGERPIERAVGFSERSVMELCDAGDYDLLVYGFGGSLANPELELQRDFRCAGIVWPSTDYFMSGLPDFPSELQRAIDSHSWSILSRAVRVRVTDPEGTDIAWSLDDNAFNLTKARWGLDVVLPGHLNAVPFGNPLPTDANGVIAGTINHCSAVPHIRIHVEDSGITSIEGGGAYGSGWYDNVEDFEDVQLPGHPRPGWKWLMECAIGTNPAVIRSAQFEDIPFGTAYERLRSGVMHWGLGASLVAIGTTPSPAGLAKDKDSYRAFFDVNSGIPDGHLHVHNYFPTVDIETRSGEPLRLVDRGRLVSLDSLEVRQVAEQFGDPDLLLREAWIPGMPGINLPGDYFADYAHQDTLAWALEELRSIDVAD